MTEFNDLYENPICPECQSELQLINDSLHTFEYDKESKRWEEINEDVTSEYIECPNCAFQREH